MRKLIGLALGFLVTVCAREAAAQIASFGFGFGGQGTGFLRTGALDARLAAAGRKGIGGPAGGFVFPIDATFGPVRLALSMEGSFTGNDATRTVQAFSGALLLGARLRQDGWVFLPAMGPSLTSLNLCVKGPAGAAPVAKGPLFDQILSSAGSGECLRSDATGMRFEIGVDREFVPSPRGRLEPSFFIGARAGVTLPLNAWWKWGDIDVDGPLAPMVAPQIGLVLGFRAHIGE
jgi:hypothetical protein